MDAQIISCAELVFKGLGTGHSEIVYHKAMEVELRTRGLHYESKVIIPILYRGLTIGFSEADLIVYESEPDKSSMIQAGLVVELKAVTYAPREAERAQIRGYLRTRGFQNGIGLLINFRQPTATNPDPVKIDWLIETPVVVVVVSAEKDTKSYNDE